MNYEYDHNIRSERLALWFANQEINSKTTSSLHCLAQAASLLWFITFKMRIKLYFLSMHRIWGGTTERTFVKLAYKLLSTREFQDFSLSIKNSGSPIFFFFSLSQSHSNNARLPSCLLGCYFLSYATLSMWKMGILSSTFWN